MLKPLPLESLPAIDIFGTRGLFDFLVSISTWIFCGSMANLLVHRCTVVKNGKQTVACRVTFYKLNIDNHGIPQTAQYQLLGCRYKQTLCST